MKRIYFLLIILLTFGCSQQIEYVDITQVLPHQNTSLPYYIPIDSRPSYLRCDYTLYSYDLEGTADFGSTFIKHQSKMETNKAYYICNTSSKDNPFSFNVHNFDIYYDFINDSYEISSNSEKITLWFFSMDTLQEYPSEQALREYSYDLYSPLVEEWFNLQPYKYQEFLTYVFKYQLDIDNYNNLAVLPSGLIDSMNSLVFKMHRSFPNIPYGTIGYSVLDVLRYIL